MTIRVLKGRLNIVLLSLDTPIKMKIGGYSDMSRMFKIKKKSKRCSTRKFKTVSKKLLAILDSKESEIEDLITKRMRDIFIYGSAVEVESYGGL